MTDEEFDVDAMLESFERYMDAKKVLDKAKKESEGGYDFSYFASREIDNVNRKKRTFAEEFARLLDARIAAALAARDEKTVANEKNNFGL